MARVRSFAPLLDARSWISNTLFVSVYVSERLTSVFGVAEIKGFTTAVHMQFNGLNGL